MVWISTNRCDWKGEDFNLAKELAFLCIDLLKKIVQGQSLPLIRRLQEHLKLEKPDASKNAILGIVHVGTNSEGFFFRGLDFDSRQKIWNRLPKSEALTKLETERIRIDGLSAPTSRVGASDAIDADETSSKALADDSLSRRTSEDLERIREALFDKGQVILYGPPGTGKTHLARKFAEEYKTNDALCFMQFHPSYSYEDFMEGIRPVLDSDNMKFTRHKSKFFQLVLKAQSMPDKKFLVFIDEINRCDLPRVFGELLFLLEYRGEKIHLPYSRDQFWIPENVKLLGTMNSADRSIALVDFALRRRFAFVRFDPEYDALVDWLVSKGTDVGLAENIQVVMNSINIAIRTEYGQDYTIGHSYFLKDGLDIDSAYKVWSYEIYPTLEELCYRDEFRIRKILANTPLSEDDETLLELPISYDKFNLVMKDKLE